MRHRARFSAPRARIARACTHVLRRRARDARSKRRWPRPGRREPYGTA
ncbi:hypothetical protein DB32_005221 [Sandaracinus amylolyticus]|uniref:Uncharacterized protein n=1 Tax=Sandaracinus amylolyticus TaxID=927083 RepID=A0A0F6YKF6_9BACT|nr:hypothetical protein DB32_005221 [Sandaracinus amylolyticus]